MCWLFQWSLEGFYMQSVEWTLPVLDSGALLSILVTLYQWSYYLLHSALWLFWYCSRALLSTDQWVADSCTNARVQVCYHCHCELGFKWINPGSRRRQRFFSSFIISFNLIAYFVTFVWITNYHHRHHHIHHHLTGLVVPLLPTRVAFMWAEASARTRWISISPHRYPIKQTIIKIILLVGRQF